jgi:FKBP-type peptidyl-prolyl cis-trans isomerase
MKEGDEWQIVIPSELGYGSQGAPGAIPPDQTLVFDMKLIAVKPAAAQ